MFFIPKKSILLLGLTALTASMTGCQNIQMAESPIPVTADFPSPLIVSSASNPNPAATDNQKSPLVSSSSQ